MKAYFLLLLIITTFYITRNMREMYINIVRYGLMAIESAVLLKAHLG